MKHAAKAFIIIILFILSLSLTGCGLRSQAREVDQLLVVQTMGLDPAPEGVWLSLAAPGTAGSQAPLRLESRGPSVTRALERIRAGANEEELFCAHIGHLLLGEAAAQEGIGALLDYVCRAGDLRLSVPLYLLRDKDAREAVLAAGDDSFSVCDALDSVDADLRHRGDGRSTPAAEVLRDLARRNCALVCAVSLQPSAENDQSTEEAAPPLTLLPAGYALLKEGRLCAWLDREQAVGVGFLTGHTGLCEIAVPGEDGRPVTLSVTGGSCSLEPEWDEKGLLCGLTVDLHAEALLAEGGSSAAEEGRLQLALERALSQRVRQVLQLSKEQGADFLDLEGRLSLRAPRRMRNSDFAALWPTLPVTVAVSARLSGTGDLEAGP